ncbi:hypothetical protein LBBP_03239 [Leptospira borgpetersenii serovar Ballum]|uniref:Uncharacterized protein n=1 Tax=Leptospira borgpetersenii serovar Ballum TaxID=280505 RepID=A0A0S2IUW8_LEPBO|nr:hypothetical protein LBBP_03239 [Leptospira borgpetersenii serovar Ballum]
MKQFRASFFLVSFSPGFMDFPMILFFTLHSCKTFYLRYWTLSLFKDGSIQSNFSIFLFRAGLPVICGKK